MAQLAELPVWSRVSLQYFLDEEYDLAVDGPVGNAECLYKKN